MAPNIVLWNTQVYGNQVGEVQVVTAANQNSLDDGNGVNSPIAQIGDVVATTDKGWYIVFPIFVYPGTTPYVATRYNPIRA